jgi:hypothetical protein
MNLMKMSSYISAEHPALGLLKRRMFRFSYQFEIKGLKGEALKQVWITARPHQKQPIDRELVSNLRGKQ